MKSFFKNVLSTIVGMVLAVFVVVLLFIGIVSVSMSSLNDDKKVKVKENSILKINLAEISVVERTSENPLEGLNFSGDLPKSIELKQVLDNIEKAKTDKNIKAIYINTPYVSAGLSQIEEIRNKLLEFKQTGKSIISYSEVYNQAAYYLSSVANKIYLNPEGIVELKGLSASIMFYKGLLNKLDIDVQIIRHGKFKGAVEPFILDKMSTANREQMQLLLNSFNDNIMDSIANQRGLTLTEVQKHANNLTLENAKSCIDYNYVDALLYQDQLEDSLKSLLGVEKLSIVTLSNYTNVEGKKKDISRNKIAIIYATGSIKSGKGDEKSIGSASTSAAIKKARKDKNVKAIVLRINSPGGSALASDVIWRETILAKAEKPIVVSMGDYAASGGYYIACAADSIVANPTTLTGSIGVFGMIPNLSKFYKNKLGITIDTVNTGKYADMGVNRPLSTFEKNKLQKSVSDMYIGFITKVGEGRNISTTEVNEIGQGRVWTGYDAKEIGLIDTYGGLEKAIDIAAYLAKVEDYRIISLPKKKNPFEQLSLKLGGEASVSNLFLPNFGFITQITQPIEELIKGDKIQARMPFIIDLK
jgi:protease-4